MSNQHSGQPKRVAAIDCGTNSIKLLIADFEANSGSLREVVRTLEMVRLGQGVDRAGRLSEGALHRVFVAIDSFAQLIQEHQAVEVRMCATSAARDAENSEEFMDGVEARLGVRPEVVDGEQEAAFAYQGAVRDVAVGIQGPYLVIDIGGGSTELILGDAEGGVCRAESLDIGSVRMTERHLSGDPPSRAEVEAATLDIEQALTSCGVDSAEANAVIGVAGTITTMAAATLGLQTYDRTLIHHAVLRRDAVQGAVAQMLARTIEERRQLGYMHPGRADVIGGGALILDRILRRTSVDSLLVSESDVLDGIAWTMS